MVDSKPVMGQVEELQHLIHDLHAEGCSINELQVGAIIEKLPSSWNDFKIYLKHKHMEMSLEDLILKLRVEEDHRKSDKVDASSMEAKANFVEASNPRPNHFQKNKEKNAKKKNNSFIHAPKEKDFKRIKGACWVCGKPRHRAQDCRYQKDMKSTNSNINNGRTNEANVTEGDMLVGVVSETNMVSDTNDWWIDTGATRHICGDKNLFSTYEPNSSGEKLYMGNASTA